MLIKNATIYDGTGNFPFKADVFISKGKINSICHQLNISDKSPTVDASNLCLAPGFINMHSHSDLEIFKTKKLLHAIRQGITTEVIGQDGSSVAPVTDKIVQELTVNMAPLAGTLDRPYWWRSFRQYLKAIESSCSLPRIVGLVGHGTIRMCVMGNNLRRPSKSELLRMKELLRTCLQEGAKGMSFGLVYPPGSYAQVEELIELAKVVSEFDGIIMVHMRDEGDHLFSSIEEMAQVAKESGVRLHISHFKALGPKNWGKVKEALNMVSKLRQEGLDIGFDQYPYTAGCTGLKRVVPDWAYEGGEFGFQERLKNTEKYKAILKEVKNHIDITRGGADKILIASVSKEENHWMSGQRLSDISTKLNLKPEEAALKMLQEDGPSVVAIYFSMDEEDVDSLITSPLQTICTDGIVGEHPHPRTYGTFPRILGHYCREKKMMTFEEAIRKMTMEPARRLRLWDRGLIREGMSADLVLFDTKDIHAQNSYIEPKKFPRGIKAVWIKGDLVYSELVNI